MQKALDEALGKWMKTLRKTFKDDMFSRYDMKPDKPLSKKDRKGKKGKGRGKKLNIDKDIKPDTDKDIKTDIDKDKVLNQIMIKIKMLNYIMIMIKIKRS